MKLLSQHNADDRAFERYRRTIAERWQDASHAKVLAIALTSAGCIFVMVLLALATI